jgi:hypothetical protein
MGGRTIAEKDEEVHIFMSDIIIVAQESCSRAFGDPADQAGRLAALLPGVGVGEGKCRRGIIVSSSSPTRPSTTTVIEHLLYSSS